MSEDTSAADATLGQGDVAPLLKKYDRPGPRYTSYPTAPVWRDNFGPAELSERLDDLRDCAAAGMPRPLSLYFHIPFCRERCLFCGCNVVISRKDWVSDPYLERLKSEMELFTAHLGDVREVIQIHLGGGTPTYFTPDQLARLMDYVHASFKVSAGAEIALEVDPCVTTDEHVHRLRQLGFNRISMGVQDLDPQVQETVHRVQPEDLTGRFYQLCRDAGFASINMDLIYGLPYQTEQTFDRTLARVIEWAPDRVAVFNYAHVPWIKPHQKQLPVEAMPAPALKFALYNLTLRRFREGGYEPIGMDHFALPGDELAQARRAERLRRNFMGYTTKPETDVLAFGVSSISEVGGLYAQNTPKLMDYYRAVDAKELATHRGVRMTQDDRIRRDVIMGIMCNLALDYAPLERRYGVDFGRYFAVELGKLQDHAGDGLVRLLPGRLEVTARGQLLVRNVAMVFDAYLEKPREDATTPVYSRTV
jgi:oxygen-independent coproporphyrinogen-3 oxidase